jgi:trimeric autotransporter adhesin
MTTRPVTVLCKAALYLAILVLPALRSYAQQDFTIGLGNTSNSSTGYPCPIQDFYQASRSQYLYTAAELQAKGMGPGMINAIKFNVTALNGAGAAEGYSVKLGGTSVGSLGATTWETLTGPVQYGPVDYQPVTGINTFVLTPGFFWNGTDNIIVEICGGAAAFTTNPSSPATQNLAFNGSHTYREDHGSTLCGTTLTANSGTQTTRPDIIFNWTSAVACSGTPAAGTATTSVSSVCLGGTFTLAATGVTVASGLTYQWQSSTDNLNWTNIAGATTPSITQTQAVSTWYRLVVTCTNSTLSSSSTLVQVTSPTLVSGTYTINKALPTGSGNFASFNDAYNFIKCGISGPVIFNVVAGSGTYTEQLHMTAVPGASATNTVTFNGNGNTLAFTSTNTNEREVIKLDGADYITFNNLVISATGTTTSQYGFGVQLINDADNDTIKNCTINITNASTSQNYAGIVVSASANSATGQGTTNCDNNGFINNTITGGYYGITLVASSTTSNSHNTITGNTINDFYNYGIYVLGSFTTNISGNKISRTTRSTVTDYIGVYVNGSNASLIINGNRFTNPFGGATTATNSFYGVEFDNADGFSGLESLVSNNLVYGLNGNGNAYGVYNNSSDNLFVYHNTIAMDGAGTPSASMRTAGINISSHVDGVYLQNNIITVTRGGAAAKYCLYFPDNTSTITSNRNDLYVDPTLTNAFIGFVNTGGSNSNWAKLPDWQNNGMQEDANSLSTDPLYQDVTTGNYQPTNAAVNDRGTYVNVAQDIRGVTRSTTTPDPGAYEWTPPGCTTPPTPGTAGVSSSPVCANTPVTLNLTGYTGGLNQTYQWQTGPSATGPFTNLGAPLNYPDTIIKPTVTVYVRAAVTCSGNTAFSTPVLLQVNPALAAGTYTIDKNAPTGGTNFTSFSDARAAMSCGILGPVVFNVVAGRATYEEQLILDSIPGASNVNTITFQGNGNTIHFSSKNVNEKAVVKLRHIRGVTFDSLRIDATGSGNYGYGIQFFNHADSNIVRKCNIITDKTSTSTDYAGIVISASETSATGTGNTFATGNQFTNNTITGGYYGATVVGNFNWLVSGNTFTGNTVQDFYSVGFYLSYTANTTVANSNVSRPTRTNSTTTYGIEVTGNDNKLTLSGNKIHNMFDAMPASTSTLYGIYMGGSGSDGLGISVYNNVIYTMNNAGTRYGFYFTFPSYVNAFHNTISMNGGAGTASTTIYGMYASGGSNIQFIDNIVTATNDVPAAKKIAFYTSFVGSPFVSDHNDLYVVPSANSFVGGWNGANNIALSDWKGASNLDANSQSMDPIYADIPNGDLEPVFYLMDNTGVPEGILVDVQGKTRSTTTPDIGAYEITVPLCQTPLNAGRAVVSPNAGICMGTPIDLNLADNTPGGRITYQWQASYSPNGPWVTISDTLYIPHFLTELGANNYFRCQIVCSGTDTAWSQIASINMNQPLIKGFYTIDPAGSGPRNYTSFRNAVAAMECGIAGWVTFDAVPGTYTEQVRMHKIPGASDTSRVTFRSQSGLPSSVTLTWAGTAAANYVLKLDSASYITYKNITLANSDATNGRVVEFAGVAAYDSIQTNVISMKTTTAANTNITGVYAGGFHGHHIVINGNTFTNGASAINFSGTSSTDLARNLVIDSNKVNGTYQYGIYTNFVARTSATRNTVTLASPMVNNAAGIYLNYADSLYKVMYNVVNISNISNTTIGIYVGNSHGSAAEQSLVEANQVTAVTGNTGSITGLENDHSLYNKTVNNVVSIATSGANSYALYSNENNNVKYYNNSFLNSSTSTGNNAAGYLVHDAAAYGNTVLRNNIFSNTGGGLALYVNVPTYINSDYNTYYTSGTNLFGKPGKTYTLLPNWATENDLDASSIVYKPAFANNTTLLPDLTSPDVWAIQGRSVQLADNDHDFNGVHRPVTLQEGVPDMGAYEFLPTVDPLVLQPVPVTPAAGTSQYFMFGSDTVARITWRPNAVVPTAITLKRYSGIKPPNLPAADKYMYFYTQIDTTGGGPYQFDLQQFYVDSWQGFIDHEEDIRLGRTDNTASWLVNDSSTVDVVKNVIADTALTFLDKFTGLQGELPNKSPYPAQGDSSNLGTRFWVGYGHDLSFNNLNDQSLLLYFTANQTSHVTVKVNGTTWSREYTVPANGSLVSDALPKSGLSDARLTGEGQYERGISIESDAPITAYANEYSGSSAGSTMLLPVGAYGYEYYALSGSQYGDNNSNSWFFVIADNDNTVIEVTPSAQTLGGHAAGVPFTVTLNKGEVYQVLGAIKTGGSYDLTGSKMRALTNSDGHCYPFAVFSGNSYTSFDCNDNAGGSSDNNFAQNIPAQGWGQHYLTAPAASQADPITEETNLYRVQVKDPATVVMRNGAPLTNLINNSYYEFSSKVPEAIDADKPVAVAQMFISASSCGNDSYSDPEVIYLTPLELAVKKASLYRNNVQNTTTNYVTLIIPSAGLSSLLIDGSNTFSYTYNHPTKPGYTIVLKRWTTSNTRLDIKSDSAFTGIAYGLYFNTSWGYNVGTLVKNFNMQPSFSNTFAPTSNKATYTCARTPFRISALLPVTPTTLTWEISKVPNILPATDVVQNAPTPAGTVVQDGKTLYQFNLPTDYMFTAPGTYQIPIKMTNPDIASCDNSLEVTLEIKVTAAPVVDFGITYSGCISDVAIYSGVVKTDNNAAVSSWKWTFADGGTATTQQVTKQYTAPGSFDEELHIITKDGCIGDTIKTITVSAPVQAILAKDTVVVCAHSDVTFTVQNADPNATYNWYNAATGGVLQGTGTTYTIQDAGSPAVYYVETVTGGCSSAARTPATLLVSASLTAPVIRTDTVGTNLIRFSWNAIPGATAYEVSTDNGATWITPSSGTLGLEHLIMNLKPGQTVTLLVKADGCEDKISEAVSATTLPDGIFIPSGFSPNGDGKNDVFLVYGDIIREIHFMVFDQWGNKLFESNTQTSGWDGTYSGKAQPSGVYIYICKIKLADGSVIERKGTINLLR